MNTNTAVSEITLSDVLRHAVDGMFIIDRDRHVVLFSEGCERITGVDRATMMGAPCACHEVMECRDEQGRSLSGALCPSLSIFSGEASSARQRMRIRHSDGREVCVETAYSPIYDQAGEVACVVGIMRDIPNLEAGESELWEATTTMDPHETIATDCRDGQLEGDDESQGQAGDMGPLDRILTTIEKREILGALKRTNGQRTLAARLLGISRSRLYRRMEALGIDPREIGPR